MGPKEPPFAQTNSSRAGIFSFSSHLRFFFGISTVCKTSDPGGSAWAIQRTTWAKTGSAPVRATLSARWFASPRIGKLEAAAGGPEVDVHSLLDRVERLERDITRVGDELWEKVGELGNRLVHAMHRNQQLDDVLTAHLRATEGGPRYEYVREIDQRLHALEQVVEKLTRRFIGVNYEAPALDVAGTRDELFMRRSKTVEVTDAPTIPQKIILEYDGVRYHGHLTPAPDWDE